MPSRPLSQAAAANLDRVLRAEREANAWRILPIRAALGIAGSLLFFFVRSDDAVTEGAIAVSRNGTYVFATVALALWGLTVRAPRILLATPFAVALIDVPLLTVIQYTQTTQLPETPWVNVPANAAMMIGLITLSALSLSWVVIVTTAIAAAISIFVVSSHGGFLPLPQMILLLVVPGVAVTCSSLVLRIRRLVRATRERDLLGKYVLGNRLGSGGMAEVFSATYSPEGGFERRVAVKRILPAFASNPEAVKLFRREAELGATLAHPNLVQVLDFGSDGGSYFLAMEFVDGCSLSDVLHDLREREQQLSVKALTTLTWCLADALSYLHDHVAPSGDHQRLIHRDLNPPNVLLSNSGEVKLSDFGVARELTGATLTEAGILRGKLPYQSPELLNGGEYEARSDLYALGVTLYECLAGRRPFTGDSDAQLVRAILDATMTPVGELRPDLSPRLAAIFTGLLERDVNQRTPSAMTVVQQLAALGADEFDLVAGRRELAGYVSAGRVASPAAMTATVTSLVPTPTAS